MPGPETSLVLTDSGPFDAVPGNGVYSGSFQPPATGEYFADISITGATPLGARFSRSTHTGFSVDLPLASFSSFSDAVQSGEVIVRANVDVQVPGTYHFSAELVAINREAASASARAALGVGRQEVTIKFSKDAIFGLGVDGPYSIENATLGLESDNKFRTADIRMSAGTTAAYKLGLFAPGLYLTGQNSAMGIKRGGGQTFDQLRVQFGVWNASSRLCGWHGGLTDLKGNRIDFTSDGGVIQAGTTSVSLIFNGNKIALAADGPYLANITIDCANRNGTDDRAVTQKPFRTVPFRSSEFTFVAADFTLAAHVEKAAPAGSVFLVRLSSSGVGALEESIQLKTESALPPEASGQFTDPTLRSSDFTYYRVTTTEKTPPGTYPLTFTGTSGSLSHAATATLTILGPQVSAPTFTLVEADDNVTQLVAIESATPGASIRYTTDRSEPSATHGMLYTEPLKITGITRFRAIAFKTGMTDSSVVQKTYDYQP